jgi:hypothetical protein
MEAAPGLLGSRAQVERGNVVSDAAGRVERASDAGSIRAVILHP